MLTGSARMLAGHRRLPVLAGHRRLPVLAGLAVLA